MTRMTPLVAPVQPKKTVAKAALAVVAVAAAEAQTQLVGAVAVVTFKSLVSSVKVVVAGAEAEARSLSMIMTSPLFELAATAHAAASKVNVKCLSRFTHACRCE